MKKRSLTFCLFVLVFLYLPLHSQAWGVLGHRIVGQIASNYLTPKASAGIKKILGTESLAMASNWADFIKSDSSFKYLNAWHYINFEKNLSYDQMKLALKKDTLADAYTQLNFLIRELKNRPTNKQKQVMYLRLLIHIVGDLHQPLHVCPVGTTGGNDVKLLWFLTPSNLHRVWDEHLIDFQQLSYTEYAAYVDHTTPSQIKSWQKEPLSVWLFDSYRIAQQILLEQTEPNPKLGYRYNFDHLQTLNNQLLKGGIHLAAILNDIFG